MPYYTVISSELFVGEDAAEAIRSYVPGAEVAVFSSLEEAARAISDRVDVVASLIIAPRQGLMDSPFVALLKERNGALLLLLSDMAHAGMTACRTLTAELPFTNETIQLMLEELSGRRPSA
ncbi:MAG: hypothetical protein ACKVKF_02855 [Rhodobacterales bacterium]|uniref:hypothetical protein n=1 Tax=Puniceibacterium antarcticum TaxID=1206336 RepID=UPI00117A077D|nr:hypothetical protein [Puniceibacterium antarcticum]